ncbi:MAG TPA: DNA mismatch repair protein MutS [Thermoanaerobacterales bacterium]|nr:DNA mismatch repair protein MutS [Thermoanaerobacterales bacterium]
MNSFIQENTYKEIGLLEMMNRIEPLCSLGRDMKSRMMPFLPGREKDLEKDLDRVSYCKDVMQHKKKLAVEIESIISHVKDIRGSLKRANSGIALDVVELYEIKNFLFQLNELDECLQKLDLDISVTPIKQLETLLDPEKTGRHTFYIENSYSRRLKWIREQKKNIELSIKEERDSLQKEIENTFGHKINPRGEIVVSKGDDKEQLISEMKNSPNLVYLRENFSSVIFAPRPTKTLTQLEDKLMKFKLKEEEEEYNIRKKLTADISRYFDILMKNSENIGIIDLLFAKAKLGVQINGIKPHIQSEQRIHIKGGRHPIVEENLRKKRLNYTPIDIDLNNPVVLITGVNMGGKTATLKMVGLLVAMAQYGLLVPADSMEFSLRNFIFLSGSSGESLAEGLSAFGAEIKSIGETIKRKDDLGLILIDELARGTNPPEGIAIASAVIETFKKRNSITVITTHFHELSQIPGIVHLQVKGLLDVDLNAIKTNIANKGILGVEALNSLMDYRLIEVKGETPPPRDAIKVARLMGFDEETLKLAEKYL